MERSTEYLNHSYKVDLDIWIYEHLIWIYAHVNDITLGEIVWSAQYNTLKIAAVKNTVWFGSNKFKNIINNLKKYFIENSFFVNKEKIKEQYTLAKISLNDSDGKTFINQTDIPNQIYYSVM